MMNKVFCYQPQSSLECRYEEGPHFYEEEIGKFVRNDTLRSILACSKALSPFLEDSATLRS